MTRTSLLPGFRFHPTDVELIMYYLKRKVLGKKLHAEAIAEVNIYKFSPWDLPDRSCLKSNDLEWFFFCPRERKYASGARMKRSTENGYWKTTGKDRSVSYNEITVGHVKTLIFHLGHAPKGERTDWVIHEYRIQNDQVPAVGVQDTYVLCKVFKKNGLGPKNGAQYGAPFKEEEWTDDDETDVSNVTFFTLDVPSPPGLLSENQCSAMASLFDPGSTSELSLVKEGPSPSTEPLTDKVHLHFSDDEMDRLLAPYVDDSMLLLNGNGAQKDDFYGERGNTFVPFLDGNNICCGLQELNSCVLMDEARIDFAETVRDDYSLNNMLLQDNSGYIELNDFLVPFNHHSETVVNNQLCDIFGTYSHEDVPYLCSSGGFPIVDQYTSCESQLDVLLANGSNMGDNSLAAFQMFYQGSGAVHDLEFTEIQAENRENVGPSFQLGQGKN